MLILIYKPELFNELLQDKIYSIQIPEHIVFDIRRAV